MLHENWLLYLDSQGCLYMSEFPMYSDVTVRAEVLEGMGPLTFHNALPFKQEGSGDVVIPVVVRVGFYSKPDLPNLSESSYAHYHGGWLPDEIAALLSLALGARFFAGDSIREFDSYDNDPLGKPLFTNRTFPPISHISTKRHILPEVSQSKDLRDICFFESFGKLSPAIAERVIQCSRQYQNALWVAESNPELCWLMLISAIEIAANEWAKSEQIKLSDLETSYPEFFDELVKNENQVLLNLAAETFAPITKATAKFIKFCKEFSPKNLEQKDSTGFKYSSTQLSKSLSTIYNHRSKALHSGIPFPAPMCSPPDEYEKGVFRQVPNSLGVYTKGAVWVGSDIPMNLHLFHFLTREILLSWVRSLEPEG